MADAATRREDALATTTRALLDAWDRETATTLRVLRAYPDGHEDLRPHAKCKTAKELAWMMTVELAMATDAVRDQMELGNGFPPAPETLPEVIAEYEASRNSIVEVLRGVSGELAGTVVFPTGPGKMGEWPKERFLWFLLHDQIHHRGQFSIYLRMADGKLPSIYGPTADEPWF